MPSPTITGTPAIINRGAADSLIDLPVAPWPSLDRVTVVDLVGPTAANRQERVMQRRTVTIADTLNYLTGTVRGVVGIDDVGNNFARKDHLTADVPLATLATQDDREHYLARDGSTMLWGRLNLGHKRSLLGATAFDINGEHWFQGPGSADVSLGDADLAIGFRRHGANDYDGYLYRSGQKYRILTTLDFGGGTAAFLSSGSSNRRVSTAAVELAVESSSPTAGHTADLGVVITGQDTFVFRATKGQVGKLSFLRNGVEFFVADTVAGFNSSNPLNLPGMSLGRVAYGSPTAWGLSDYSAHAIQIPYAVGNAFRICVGQFETLAVYGEQAVITGRLHGVMSAIPALSNSAWGDGNVTLTVKNATGAVGTHQPRIGFEREGQNACALYYNGVAFGKHELRVRGSDGFDDRLSYVSENGAFVSFDSALSTLGTARAGYFDYDGDVTFAASQNLPAWSVIRIRGNLTLNANVVLTVKTRDYLDSYSGGGIAMIPQLGSLPYFVAGNGYDTSVNAPGGGGVGGNGGSTSGGGSGGSSAMFYMHHDASTRMLRYLGIPMIGGWSGSRSNGTNKPGAGGCVIIVDGNITFGANSRIEANGLTGNQSQGGAGAGSVQVIARGNITYGAGVEINARGGNGNKGGGSGDDPGAGGGGYVGVHCVGVFAGTVSIDVSGGTENSTSNGNANGASGFSLQSQIPLDLFGAVFRRRST